jgi:hypothetical protein
MPIILSLTKTQNALWAAGPEGLFKVNGHGLEAVPQPQQELACCGSDGARILVGGLPHGTAFTVDDGNNWQASWMDGVDTSVLCIAPDPRAAESGVLLAGSAGGGILRSANRGHGWEVCNYGLQDYTILSLAWAPVALPTAWPKWEIVFAATEDGVYRSPNAGRGWRRSEGLAGVVQVVAVSPNFHQDGLVLAGTEEQGIWYSTDGGRHFSHAEDGPQRVDAITTTANGWLLSDADGLWQSVNGINWERIPGSKPALVLLNSAEGVWVGGENGVELLSL